MTLKGIVVGQQISPLFEGKYLRALQFSQRQSALVVTFDHWRNDRAGFPKALPSNSFAKAGFDHIRIESSRNDWFLNEDLGAVMDVLRKSRKAYASCISIGFSMGGFGAAIFQSAVNAEHLHLVSPRIPEAWRGILAICDSTNSPQKSTSDVFISYDPHIAKDSDHVTEFEKIFPKCNLVVMPNGGHPASEAIRKSGLYWKFQQELLSPNPCRQRLGKVHRQSLQIAKRKSTQDRIRSVQLPLGFQWLLKMSRPS